MNNCAVGLGEATTDDGTPVKVLVFTDQHSAITVKVPLVERAARDLAAAITGIHVANGTAHVPILQVPPGAQGRG